MEFLNDVSWPQVGLGSGWVVAIYCVRLLFNGGLVTRREADTYVKRAETAEANLEKSIGSVAKLTAVSQLQKATIDAALKVSAQNANPTSGDEP